MFSWQKEGKTQNTPFPVVHQQAERGVSLKTRIRCPSQQSTICLNSIKNSLLRRMHQNVKLKLFLMSNFPVFFQGFFAASSRLCRRLKPSGCLIQGPERRYRHGDLAVTQSWSDTWALNSCGPLWRARCGEGLDNGHQHPLSLRGGEHWRLYVWDDAKRKRVHCNEVCQCTPETQCSFIFKSEKINALELLCRSMGVLCYKLMLILYY